MKRKAIALCLVVVLLFSMAPAAFAADAAYPDVAVSDWFYTYVSELSKSGVISGYPDGAFRPYASVTYGEALKMILLAAEKGEQSAAGGHWAGGYLQFAQNNGYLSANEMIDLDAPITRLAVAQLAARALGLTPVSQTSPFADCSEPEVIALYEAGIIEGTTQGGTIVFDGGAALKRSEVSAIIYRINQHGKPEETPKKQITYGSYTLDVLEDVPVCAYDSSLFSMNNGRMSYQSDKVKLVQGIDVSSYQGVIDWQKVKADGIDFAMLRVGYRGYTVGNIKEDTTFHMNVKNALAAGVEVGVYFFSQAINVAEAQEEAQFVLSQIQGYNITYPVVFDWEVIGSKDARTYGLDSTTLDACAQAFCTMVQSAGYKPMVYFNQYCGYVKYNLSNVKQYDFWYAQYSSKPSFYYNYQIWQYSDKGSVNGIKGNVDMDILFVPVS